MFRTRGTRSRSSRHPLSWKMFWGRSEAATMAWLEIARTGITSLRLHPWRSVATVACVLAALGPYLAGVGICGGLAADARRSIDEGADLYVTGRQFGRSVPLPLDAVEKIAALPGVTDAVA